MHKLYALSLSHLFTHLSMYPYAYTICEILNNYETTPIECVAASRCAKWNIFIAGIVKATHVRLSKCSRQAGGKQANLWHEYLRASKYVGAFSPPRPARSGARKVALSHNAPPFQWVLHFCLLLTIINYCEKKNTFAYSALNLWEGPS